MQGKPNPNNTYIGRTPAPRADRQSVLGAELMRVERTLDENVNAGAAPEDRPVVMDGNRNDTT